MCPVAFGSDGSLELCCGELAKAIGLVFDSHGEECGMLDEVAWVVAYIRAVGAILHCCKLDDSGLALLLPVSNGLVSVEVGRRTLNVPFFRAVSKYPD